MNTDDIMPWMTGNITLPSGRHVYLTRIETIMYYYLTRGAINLKELMRQHMTWRPKNFSVHMLALRKKLRPEHEIICVGPGKYQLERYE